MTRLKRGTIILMVAAIGGFLAGSVAAPLAVRFNFLNSANLLTKFLKAGDITTKIEERTIVVPKADYFAEAVDKVSHTVVAIQSFRSGRLIRSGSGLILTQDGLIVSLNSVVPVEAEIVQIMLNGQLYKGAVVARNYTNNLALLTVPESNFPVSRLDYDRPELARSLLLLARAVELGKDTPLLAGALVSQLKPDGKSFAISSPYNIHLYGAGLLDSSGNILGLVDFKNNQPVVISALAINTELGNYLQRVNK